MRKRLIPILQLQGRKLVKTKRLKEPVYIGDPINACRIFSEKNASEILICNIKASKDRVIDFFHLEEICEESFVPLAYIGGVTSLKDFDALFSLGFEKVGVDQLLFTDPDVVKSAVEKYGSSSVMGSVTVQKTRLRGKYFVKPANNVDVKLEINQALDIARSVGCGEFLVHASYNEGCYSGLDSELFGQLPSWLSSYPVTYTGGIGCDQDISDVFDSGIFTGVGLGSLCVFSRKRSGILIRYPQYHDT